MSSANWLYSYDPLTLTLYFNILKSSRKSGYAGVSQLSLHYTSIQSFISSESFDDKGSLIPKNGLKASSIGHNSAANRNPLNPWQMKPLGRCGCPEHESNLMSLMSRSLSLKPTVYRRIQDVSVCKRSDVQNSSHGSVTTTETDAISGGH